ncbi:MAG TPA: glycoside hydrolase family 32 protein, partial [Chthoniobacteraceae bacterium]|nr:glycoside hydrolase family 32 protein [Chthoniobacteraceae bacterium]
MHSSRLRLACAAVATAGAMLSPIALSDELYRERFRPQFHFTPERNWINDPNGMVYFEGEYHLFYQYNPFGDRWGHMSWGHAVSRDLVHWKHLPLALPEEDGIMIFSGSAVVDWKNTSGFGSDGKPPLVAIYTGHRERHQDQRIAYSNDRGRTWTKYSGNPVLDLKMADFRDPKVFWDEKTSHWIMVVALSTEKKIHLYGSSNFREWKYLSEFGPAGAVDGLWECPDLFPLPIDGESNSQKWVLIVNIN